MTVRQYVPPQMRKRVGEVVRTIRQASRNWGDKWHDLRVRAQANKRNESGNTGED